MRLIDADELRQVLAVYTETDTLGHTPLQLCDAMPTVEAIPVEWLLSLYDRYEYRKSGISPFINDALSIIMKAWREENE